jgi:hypothetical protein
MLVDLLFVASALVNGVLGNFISYKINKNFIVDPIHILTGGLIYDDSRIIMVKDILVFAPISIMTLYNPIHAIVMAKLYALCSFLRPICYLSTSLPPPNNRFLRIIKNPFHTISGSKGDLIYSGHVTFVTSSLLVINRFYDVPYLFTIAYLAVTGFLTSMTRSHYTVDVTISFIITSLLTTLISSARPDTVWGRLGDFIFNVSSISLSTTIESLMA